MANALMQQHGDARGDDRHADNGRLAVRGMHGGNSIPSWMPTAPLTLCG